MNVAIVFLALAALVSSAPSSSPENSLRAVIVTPLAGGKVNIKHDASNLQDSTLTVTCKLPGLLTVTLENPNSAESNSVKIGSCDAENSPPAAVSPVTATTDASANNCGITPVSDKYTWEVTVTENMLNGILENTVFVEISVVTVTCEFKPTDAEDTEAAYALGITGTGAATSIEKDIEFKAEVILTDNKWVLTFQPSTTSDNLGDRKYTIKSCVAEAKDDPTKRLQLIDNQCITDLRTTAFKDPDTPNKYVVTLTAFRFVGLATSQVKFSCVPVLCGPITTEPSCGVFPRCAAGKIQQPLETSN
jgi:hypothetical protein